jgi:uncharacterized membrane protein
MTSIKTKTEKGGEKYSRENIIHGTAIAAVSVIYFLSAMYYLNTYGLGVMTWRFQIFMRWEENGLFAVISNVIRNPALLLASVLSVPEKLEFLFYMLIPLNFLILIAPMIIMNLATDYVYQYNINFQYTYGVLALLFFLSVKHISDLGLKARQITKICVAMACFSLILSVSNNYHRIQAYRDMHSNFREEFAAVGEILEKIPIDASVSSCTFIVPHLIKRENVFMVDLFAENYFDYNADYLVNDLRGADRGRYANFVLEIERRGYELYASGGFVEIFRKVRLE